MWQKNAHTCSITKLSTEEMQSNVPKCIPLCDAEFIYTMLVPGFDSLVTVFLCGVCMF